MTAADVVLGTLVVLAGACLQGVVGFGSNLVAAPLLVLVSTRFVPAPLIVVTTLLNVLVTRREGRASVDKQISWAIVGQVGGALAAGVALLAVSDRGLSVLFAGIVLTAVALSVGGWHLPPTPRTLAGAGVAAGFMGTISGIGGPPIALVYQRADAPTLRGTLARFFLAGGAISIATLAAVGHVDAETVVPTLVLVPGMVAGFLLSRPLVRRLDRATARPVVLVLSTAAALAVLARELL
ncbi:MAG: sulfite exporter TauE/SafE family protein [Acidimicrobiales bacterium]